MTCRVFYAYTTCRRIYEATEEYDLRYQWGKARVCPTFEGEDEK